MAALNYNWQVDGDTYEFHFVEVAGTEGKPYLFGRGHNKVSVEVSTFYMATTPVTQALWLHVMGVNESKHRGLKCPVENVSWDHLNGAGGFLERINSGEILSTLAGDQPQLKFRLPTETEWEYAARGGPHWQDNFVYSGSNNPDEVAWYGPRWNKFHELLGWRTVGRLRLMNKRPTRIHDVATKASNQLGIYDMSGNVWEWCQDVCTDDPALIPKDGTAYLGSGDERRLRGGCHHNWNLHCTVSWRYGIVSDAHDGCIGFRLVLAPAQPN